MIEINNISLRFADKIILKDISISIEQGTTSVILGPSGAGKSTILKAILGLYKVDSGTITVDGEEISSMQESGMLNVRKKIGMVFQGNALFDSMTVEDNISYFLSYNSKLTQKEITSRIEEVLSYVNLEGTGKLYPEQLSGGMKKRLAVARALVTSPKIILFDEPTTGLDPINSKAVLDLINKLKAEGTTSVVVTHILNDAISIGDVLTVINDGGIVASGGVEEILSSKDNFVKDFFYEIYNNLNSRWLK